MQGYDGKMLNTNFLRSTGLLDGYESVVSQMVEDGWPSEKSVFEHAAYLLLKWQGENQDKITVQAAAFRQNFLLKSGEPVPTSANLKDYSRTIQSAKKKPKNYDEYVQKKAGNAGKRIVLKSKKEFKYSEQKIDVSVFEGEGKQLALEGSTSMFKSTMPDKKGMKKLDVNDAGFEYKPISMTQSPPPIEHTSPQPSPKAPAGGSEMPSSINAP